MSLRRLLSVACGVGLALVGTAPAALAAPPDPSALSVSATNLAPGQVFTATVELYNPAAFTVTSAQASLRMVEANIRDIVDVVSCTGTVAPCFNLETVYRGPVGDLPSGQQRTVVFTLQVKETAPAGSYTIGHQHVGSNFAFEGSNGPVVTVTPQAADLSVSLNAVSSGLLTSRVTYTVRVANLGPGNASAVRISGAYVAGFSWAGGNGCVRGSGRNVNCDFASIPVGTTASASFSVDAGLLALGSFTTTMSRASSTPADPVASNDSASRSCTAVTGLIVVC
jgi:hypothetical protein